MIFVLALSPAVLRGGKFFVASIFSRENTLEVLKIAQSPPAERVAPSSGGGSESAAHLVEKSGSASLPPARTPGQIRADLVLLESQPTISGAPESNEETGEDESLYLDVLPAVQGVAFLESAIPDTADVVKRTEIYTYIVEAGDTPSGIANLFGISLSTLLWENKLSQWSLIRPGDRLVILPATGISHKVIQGETVASIAKKYSASADDIVAFNNLPVDGALTVGGSIIVPDGIPPAPPRPVAPRVVQVAPDNNPPGWLIQPAPGRNGDAVTDLTGSISQILAARRLLRRLRELLSSPMRWAGTAAMAGT